MGSLNPVSPTSAPTNPEAQISDGSTLPSSLQSLAPIPGNTWADLTASPSGQAFVKVLQDAMTLQMATECKRHNAHLIETMKQARRDAQQ